MKKLDGTRLGDKKSLNINRLFLKKSLCFNKKIRLYCRRSWGLPNKRLKIVYFQQKSLIFNTKKRSFLTKSLILKNSFNLTKNLLYSTKNSLIFNKKNCFIFNKKISYLNKMYIFSQIQGVNAVLYQEL